MRLHRFAIACALAGLLAGCVSASKYVAIPPHRQQQPVALPRPAQAPAMTPPIQTHGFIPPQIMRGPGLEEVSGAIATKLLDLFGPPALDVPEGDARKLQFRGRECVLDVFLYPLRPGGEPSATWIEARRPDNGAELDRAGCIAALRR